MKRICLISDTHGHLDEMVQKKIEGCDEIWHAGDVGTTAVLRALEAELPTRAVYGNIDGAELRRELPLDLSFTSEQVRVLITHIAGRAGRYPARVEALLEEHRPQLFICGHSHILQIARAPCAAAADGKLLHVNPGACGNSGLHKVKTLVRFTVDDGEIRDMEAVEWPRNV